MFFLGRFLLGLVWYPPKEFPGPMRSYIVKENHIGSVASKILQYKQKTQKLTNILLLFHKNETKNLNVESYN